MIFDRLENLSRYAGVLPGAGEIVKFLAECAVSAPESGRHVLDGDKLFVNVQSYDTKPFDPGKLEYHRKYIDIQLLFSGRESIYFSPLDGLETVMEYSEQSDCGLDRLPSPASGTELELVPGNFAVFFPEEGHMPGVGDGGKAVKAVVKIAVG